MMVCRLASALRRDQAGATIVEFALVLPATLLIIIGGMNVAHQSYVRTLLQGALNEAARDAAVQNPRFATPGDTLEDRIEGRIAEIIGPVFPEGTIEVTQQSFFDFSNIGNPEPLTRDVNENGQFDRADGDCWQDINDNGDFDTDAGAAGRGDANDVVFYTATASAPRLFPAHVFLPISARMELEAQTAVRNQPFGTQPTPPVLCGED